MKKIYAKRGEILRQQQPTGKALLQLKYQWYLQDYLACVASVDDNVGRVLDYLDQHQLQQNTLVIYTGDQGMYLGENGWFDKRWMYDVSMNAPLLMRWPEKIKAGSTLTQMTQSIDYAPTMLDAAGIPVPDWMQGLSLKGIMSGEKKTLPRKELYYHFYEYQADHTVLPHLGIRTDQFKLIYFYTVGEWELYDLLSDPGEQQNLFPLKRYQQQFKSLKNQLIQLRSLYDDHEKAGELN